MQQTRYHGLEGREICTQSRESLGSPSIQLALKYMTSSSSTTLMSMLTAYLDSSDCFAIRYFTRVELHRYDRDHLS